MFKKIIIILAKGFHNNFWAQYEEYDGMDILPRNSSFNKSYAEFNGDQCLS